MPRRIGETAIEYRDRVLNSKTPSFCGAKWYNATIWLGRGVTSSCHHPKPHKLRVSDVEQNPKALHNTPQKKRERLMMQSGERPPGCHYCWNIEDASADNVSDRVYKSELYSDADLEAAFRLPSSEDVDLQTLEIAFDRTCNFACSYCTPDSSSTWANDIKRHGPYRGMHSDWQVYASTRPQAQRFHWGEQNPFVEGFFRWWEGDLHKTLQELRVTGGEPTLSPDFWRLLSWFAENDGGGKIRLAVNTNLGAKDSVVTRLVEESHRIRHLHVYTSAEAVGAQAEYLRDGLDYRRWSNNVVRLLEHGRLEGLHLMCTVGALCLESLPNLLDWCLELKGRFGCQFPVFTLNLLHYPRFQSTQVLPPSLRRGFRADLEKWLRDHADEPLLLDIERQHLERLVLSLGLEWESGKGNHSRSSLEQDARAFFGQYDQRRSKSLPATFPRLRDWFLGIEPRSLEVPRSSSSRAWVNLGSKHRLPIARW